MAGLRLAEKDWQKRVIDTALIRGWRVCHLRPARTSKGWRTAYEGHTGLPDLILAKNGEVFLIELKSDDPASKVTTAQQAWITTAGHHGAVWRPADWPFVLAFLSSNTPTLEGETP